MGPLLEAWIPGHYRRIGREAGALSGFVLAACFEMFMQIY